MPGDISDRITERFALALVQCRFTVTEPRLAGPSSVRITGLNTSLDGYRSVLNERVAAAIISTVALKVPTLIFPEFCLNCSFNPNAIFFPPLTQVVTSVAVQALFVFGFLSIVNS